MQTQAAEVRAQANEVGFDALVRYLRDHKAMDDDRLASLFQVGCFVSNFNF